MTTIDFETYGRIIARVACRPGARLGEILTALGVDQADLDRDEPALRQELSEAWANRRGISAMKFAAALAKELTALQFLAASTAPNTPGGLPPSPAAPPEVVIPSFLHPVQLPGSPPTPLLSVVPEVPPEPPPAVYRPPARLAGTMDADLSAIVAAVERGALPFNPSTAAPADTPPLPGAVPSPSPLAPQRPHTSLTGTVATSVAAFAPATPFATPEAPAAPGEIDFAKYPLELYAAIVGALARGEPRERVLAEFRLTEAVYEQLAHAWSARFQGEPQLQLQFNALARSGAARGPRKG